MGEKVQMRFHRRMSLSQKLIFGIGMIACILLIFFYTFRLEEIQVEESNYYSKEEIITYLKKSYWDNNTLLFYWNVGYRYDIDIPFIQQIDIQYVNRNTVKIELYEKSVVGCVEYMNEFVYFDKDGKVLEISTERIEDIPLFTGVNFSEMKLHDSLNVSDVELFEVIKNISQRIQLLKVPVDKVYFDIYQNVTLYTKDIKVLLGNRTNYDEQIAELVSILPEISDLKGELDLRDFSPGQEQIIFRETK